MTDAPRTRHIVVMGVSGVGKTTIAKGISSLTGWTFAEGDAFHSDANVAKMRDGHPLTDEDRWPWLRSIGAWMSDEIDAGRSAVITCSALRRAYRDVLREGRPEVEFCHLVAEPGLVGDRMEHRQGHYMPRSLLDSQYSILEPLDPDEPGVEVSVEGSVPEVMHRAMDGLHLPYLDPDTDPDTDEADEADEADEGKA